jgi:elongation factor P
MDTESYEQVNVPAGIVGEMARYLSEGAMATVALYQSNPIAVELPASAVLKVNQTQTAVRGDTRSNVMKPATLETGHVVQVPLFVEEGERIKVDTRTGNYIERVK